MSVVHHTHFPTTYRDVISENTRILGIWAASPYTAQARSGGQKAILNLNFGKDQWRTARSFCRVMLLLQAVIGFGLPDTRQ